MLRVTGVSSGSSSARLLSVPCWALYQFPPLCSSVDGHFVARFLHFCYQWRKKRAARGGFARRGALGLPGAGHGLASLSGRINKVPDLSGRRFIES